MSLLIQCLIAFGGGVYGALIGGTNAFIFTGLVGLVGVGMSLMTGDTVFIDQIAAGPFLAPHIGFASGVAGLAVVNQFKLRLSKTYASTTDITEKNRIKSELNNYQEITGLSTFTPLFGFKYTPAILIAGGFAVMGFLFNFYISQVVMLRVDTVALTIVLSNILVRLTIAKGAIFTLDHFTQKRKHLIHQMGFTLAWGIPYSLTMAYVTLALGSPLVVFYISALSLILKSVGKDIPVTHHISLVAAYAALQFNSLWMGMLFGVIALLVGEIVDAVVNDQAESLIDMPSTVICLLSFIVFLF